MKRMILSSTLVLVSLLVWNQLSSSEKPNAAVLEEKKTAPLETVAPQSPDPVLNDILQIREAAGSALRGSVLEQITGKENQNQNAFEQILQRLATEAATRRASQDVLPVDTLPERSPPSPALPFVSTLRWTSRLLDDRANDLEDARQYADAQRLRKLATQLRREARAADASGQHHTGHSQ